MGKIITIKNNKGGVGKSWLTLQLAHGMALAENKKILVLTSDSQNNILLYSGYSQDVKEGLEDFVLKNEETQIRLRENVYYLPLLTNNFSLKFREKLKEKLITLKNEYDFIFIDSVPVLNIDNDFLEVADNIIIPTTLDAASIQGILKLMNELGVEKIKAVVPNLYMPSRTSSQWLNTLMQATKGTNIYLSSPVKRLQFIADLAETGKTIWESKVKSLTEYQIILYNVIQELKDEEE